MSIIVCGVAKGKSKHYECGCCGFESDDLEQFAIWCCWACVFGNPDCEACKDYADDQ